jgi:methylenetetrahydrofolate reductase (NADPH)
MMHLSLEFFPPKTPEMEQKLWEAVTRLAPLKPGFVSVTYGAGGSTRERTHSTLSRILQETSLVPAAHLTCVAATRDEVDTVARQYWEVGVRHIVALRGDMPGGGAYVPHPGGYAYADELVAGLKRIGDFEISVAAFPEMHPESKSFMQDMEVLKRKVAAGATRAITQYFFEADTYFKFLDRVRKAGIEIPVVPGILPITNFAQAVKFSTMCGASVPAWLGQKFDGLDEKPEARHAASVEVAVKLCRDLQAGGVEQLHFYTLNRAELVLEICGELGVSSEQQAASS